MKFYETEHFHTDLRIHDYIHILVRSRLYPVFAIRQ